MFALMVKKLELIKKLRDMNLGIQVESDHIWCSRCTITNDFLGVIKASDNTLVDAIKLILLNYNKFSIFKIVVNKIKRVKSILSHLPTNTKLILKK